MNTISSKSEANQNNTKSDIPVTLMAILKRPSFVEVNIKRLRLFYRNFDLGITKVAAKIEKYFVSNFLLFYCIIILIVILIRLKEFTCVNYCAVYLDALTLRLFISRK